jgi:hypothetical protein
VLASRSAQFQSAVYGCGSVDVIWSLELVRGIPTAGLGTIEGDGTYDAPASSNDTFVLLVRATGLDCSDRSGIARVMVPAQPRAFLVELENFTAGFDIPGSKVLKSEHCGSASGGMSVVGMDRSGEHIEVPMTVRGAGRYLAYVGYAAESGDFIRVKVEVEGCGASGTATDFELKEGTGTG